jgi:NAD(P)-dependent dehydrogenase (short-subunit alcohol dehydrogenase family)
MAGSVTVFGGTGFIGRHLVARFLRSGKTVRVAVRHPGRVQMATVSGQPAELIQADVLDDVGVGAAIAGVDAVVNLVGILTETTTQTYRAIHVEGARRVALAVTDIDLSMDDRFLYVACWGTGEMRQYDVTDPRKPKLAGSVHVGGIARRTPHPSGKLYAGGPQMVEISRDGKRVYWTNSLYSTWDDQFYPDGVPGAQVMANANASGGLELAKDYWVSFPDGYRAHQIRLEGGDCSTDSFCYPSV